MLRLLPVLAVLAACTQVPDDTGGLPPSPQTSQSEAPVSDTVPAASPVVETSLAPETGSVPSAGAETGAPASAVDTNPVEVPSEVASVPQIENDLPVCRADGLTDLIGQPLSAGQGRIPDTARIIRPGDLVVQDFRRMRMNVDLDASDQITRFWCG